MYRKEGRKNKKESAKNVLAGMFSTSSVRLSTRSFRALASARKNETLFKDGAATKTKRVLLATLRFEGERERHSLEEPLIAFQFLSNEYNVALS